MMVSCVRRLAGRWLVFGARKFIEDSHYSQNLHSEKYIPEKVYLIFVAFGDLMLFFSHIDFRLVLVT